MALLTNAFFCSYLEVYIHVFAVGYDDGQTAPPSCEQNMTRIANGDERQYVLTGEDIPTSSHEIIGLRAMTFYCIKLKSSTPMRSSAWTVYPTAVTTLQPSAPSAPLNVFVSEITHKSFRVTWSPPSSDGGIFLTNYTVYRKQYSDDGMSLAEKTTYASTTSVLIMTNNDPHQGDATKKKYEVSVSTENLGKRTSDRSSIERIQVLVLSTDLHVNETSMSLWQTLNSTTKLGQKVIVGMGNYTLEKVITMRTDQVELRSVNGSRNTIIDLNRSQFFRCDPDKQEYAFSRIIGFTIMNGDASDDGLTPHDITTFHAFPGSVLFYNVHTAVVLKDIVFRNNRVRIDAPTGVSNFGVGGAVTFYHSRGPFLMYNCVFESNHANGGGGAIAALDSIDLRIYDSKFINNTAVQTRSGSVTSTVGGAIFGSNFFNPVGITGEAVTILAERSLFEGNTAFGNGGAVALLESVLTGSDVTFLKNHALHGEGGAVHLSRSSFKAKADDSTPPVSGANGTPFYGVGANLTGNSAKSNGGAVFVGGGSIDFQDSVFVKNVAVEGNGGAVDSIYSFVRFGSCNFTSNLAGHSGGAIAATMESNIKLTMCTMKSCSAQNGDGGALYVSDSPTFTVTDSTISFCTANNGGGMYVLSASLVSLRGGTFANCSATATGGGGAVYAKETKHIYAMGTTFIGNQAMIGGGGAILWGFSPETMGHAGLSSPLIASPSTGLALDQMFVENKASYGDDVASGAFVLIQSAGPCQTTRPSFRGTDIHFGKTATFDTVQTIQGSGENLGTREGNFPAFSVLDFYGSQINTNFEDTVTVALEATLVNSTGNSSIDFADVNAESELGRLLSAPTFAGTTRAALEKGTATFALLQLLGVPGSTYTGKISSSIEKVASTFQITLDTCKPGQKIEKTRRPICTPCQEGRYSDKINAFLCSPCPVGKHSSAAASSCSKCPAGKFQASTGSFQCDDCPVNTFMNSTGAGSCTACQSGKFQDIKGKISCKFCPGGKFRSTGDRECQSCSPGMATGEVAGAVCSGCPNGTYSDNPGLQYCKTCDSGTYSQYKSESGTSICTSCKDFSWTKGLTGQADCTPCVVGEVYAGDKNCRSCSGPTSTDEGQYSFLPWEKECHDCPEGGHCPGGSLVVPKSGWWLSSGRDSTNEPCSASATNLPPQCGRNGIVCTQTLSVLGEFYDACGVLRRIHRCSVQRDEDDPLGPVCNPLPWQNRTLENQCVCNDVECYTGKLCEKCARGFAKRGKYECRACVDKNYTVIVFSLGFIGLLAMQAVYVNVLMATVGLSETTSSGVKIVMNAFQMIALSAGFPLRWPAVVMNLFSSLGGASASTDGVLQFDCVLQDVNLPVVYQKTIFIAALPPFSVAFVFVCLSVSSRLKKRRRAKTAADRSHNVLMTDEHDKMHEERQAKVKEKKALIKEVHHVESVLAAHHKFHLRANKESRHTPPLDKVAVEMLRRAFADAYNKGIDIEASVNHFHDHSRGVMDVRHCTQILRDWDVGLSDNDLQQIQSLLDFEGDIDILKKDFLQYHHGFWDKFILAVSIVLYQQYPILCKTALSLLGCNAGLEDGGHLSYLTIDYEVPCFNASHLFMISFVILPMVIVYIIGMPLGTLYVLLRHARAGKMTDKVRFKFGMFTDGYNYQHIWWEAVVALRKACVVAISVGMSSYGPLPQVYAGILLVSLYACVHMLHKPYANTLLNNLETYGMVVAYTTLYAGIMFYQNYLFAEWLLVTAEVLVMIINIGYVVYAFSEIVLDYAINMSDDPKFVHFAIRYHKMTSCCLNSMTKSKSKAILEKLHHKLEKRVHESADKVLMVQKFKKNMVKRGKTIKSNGSSKKVAPINENKEENNFHQEIQNLRKVRKKHGASSKEYKKATEELEKKKSESFSASDFE